MNDLFHLLKLLPNPLLGSFVGDPWTVRDADPDVSEIHRPVFRTCLTAVEEARNASCSSGIVIHGQAGSGKTHLIGRLRRKLIDDSRTPQLERLSHAFAYIKLNTNAGSLTRHVRRSVAVDLLRSQRHGWNQFERMVISRLMEVAEGEGDMAGFWEYFLEERAEHELDGMLQQLQASENLSPAFVRVLGWLIRKRHLLDVAGWLRGDPLSEAALVRLDLGAGNDNDDPELQSLGMLLDFMRLAGAKVPLVLCFDQIEALQTSPNDVESFERFGHLMTALANADPNLVLISCLQSSRYDLLKQAIPGYAIDRIQSRAAMSLNPLLLEQARALLALRLAPLAESRPAEASEIWPFTDSDLQRFVGSTGCSARELIVAAAQRFEALRMDERAIEPIDRPLPMVANPAQWFEDEWERREAAARQANTPEATAEILSDGLPRLIGVVAPDWKVSPAQQGVAFDYILTAPNKEAQVGIKICEGPPNGLQAKLKTLATLHPAKTNLQKLVLLRDERIPISKTAKKTLEHLDVLQKNDALFRQVAPQTLAALDALRQLLSDAAAGDLACGAETIDTDRVLAWLRNHLPDSLKELADVLVTQQGGDPGETGVDGGSVFLSSLQEWLSEKCIARWSEALEGIDVSGKQADALLAAAEQRTDLFGVIRGEPTVVFSSRMASPHLASTSTSS